MKKNWEIRKAKSTDAHGLQECMEASYATYLERFSGSCLPPMDVDYADEIANFPVWVAVSADAVAGGLVMMFDDEQVTLANIAVHPEFQGQGLGKGLMSFAETAARERGYKELHLATHKLLSENVSLYLHLGWDEVNRDESRVYMRKAL